MNESLTQKEGKVHNEDTAKANRKIPLPEKTYKALEKKAKAEGKTADQKAAEIIEQKAKDVFAGKINKYGFLHFSKDLMETLGWPKGEDIAVKITKTANGITVERA
jgi:hypothetical protein